MTRLLRHYSLIVVLFAGLLGSATHALGAEQPAAKQLAAEHPDVIFDKSIGGVVWIETPSGTGSGFLVDAKRKLVVTNYHVTEGKDTANVYFPVRDRRGVLIRDRLHYLMNTADLGKTGHFSVGRVVAQAPSKDLVVLQIETLPASAVELGLANSDPGSDEVLHVLGNPGGRGLWLSTIAVKPKNTHVHGKYSDFPVAMDYKGWEYVSSTFGGNSGGPVLNDAGKVIGVHSSGDQTGRHGGAVHYSEVASLLATLAPHQVVRIENRTTSTLRYQIRWGEDDLPGFEDWDELNWEEFTLKPGQVMTHSRKVVGENMRIRIRFDRSTEEGFQEQVDTLGYSTLNLGPNVLPGPKQDAEVYSFQYDGRGGILKLSAKKK